MLVTLTKEVVHVHVKQDKRDIDHGAYEGEVRMSQPQQDYYKQIIGDGLASVTVSRELSENDYGNGGKVMVSITLRCDQSQQWVNTAVEYAKALADQKVWEHHTALKQQLVQRGILKP